MTPGPHLFTLPEQVHLQEKPSHILRGSLPRAPEQIQRHTPRPSLHPHQPCYLADLPQLACWVTRRALSALKAPPDLWKQNLGVGGEGHTDMHVSRAEMTMA